MTDLVPVAPLIESDLVLVVHPSVPAKNLKELLALARAKPGTLNYGSSGPGSNYHMAGELLKNITGIDIVHVPYKGSTGARTDILSGQIQMLFDSVPTMAQMIEGRHGACARHQRHETLADPARRADARRKPACPVSRRRSGSASWRRQARRSRSSTCSIARSPRSCSGRTSRRHGKSTAPRR